MAKKNWAVILCSFDDVPPSSHPVSFYEDFFVNTGNGGAIDYWYQVSNGTIDISGSQVFGWYDSKQKYADTKTDRQSIFDMGVAVAKANNVDLSLFLGTIVFVNAAVDSGQLGPLGDGKVAVGFMRIDLDDTWSANFVLHEMGHAFGLNHSRGPDPAANGDLEYGDRWCVMGYGYSFNDPTFRATGPGICAPKVAYLGGFDNSRVFQSTFDDVVELQIAALESPETPGYLMARTPVSVRAASGTYTSVEFRVPQNWDRSFPSSAVLVHRFQPDGHTDLLAPPGSQGSVEWQPGQRFVDAANGLFVRVTAFPQLSAIVQIGPYVEGWEPLNGIVKGEVTLASWGASRLDACAWGVDNEVYHRYANNEVWGPNVSYWENLKGIIAGSPAMTSWGDQRLDIVARGPDGGVWHKFFDHGTWGRPAVIGSHSAAKLSTIRLS